MKRKRNERRGIMKRKKNDRKNEKKDIDEISV